jgi:photosystem II stability/assembly factor-like uncharacterized protein
MAASTRFLLLLSLCAGVFTSAFTQTPTPAATRLAGFEQRKTLKTNNLLSALEPKSIGPSVFSCRVTDLDVNPADPTEMYVAYASGGLWHSTSNGTTFSPVFEQEASMTIGDIAVDWRNRVIWVGTGEVNSSRSSYAGTGVYRSADNGKNWEWRGLPESHHIGRVVLHPTDPNTLWVAVLGHLYSPNEERGVFKTTDGGKNWTKTLFVDTQSGAIDLCLDPIDPNTVYAATWQRSRTAWNFDGAGEGSAIWKSTDGGNTFQRISSGKSGFINGAKTGRIGLCAGLKNGKTILYASVDNQNAKPKTDASAKKEELTKEQLRKMSTIDFAQLDNDKLKGYLKSNDFPEKYTPESVKQLVASGKIKPTALVEYLEDANNNLFETDFIGAQVYRSDDGGRNWNLTHEEPLEQMNFTYGYYFSVVRCQPDNADQVYLLGYNIIESHDGGKNWSNINRDNVHADHHALWVNPARAGHLVNGNDGGVNISWDNGQSWIKANNPPVGQFYAIAADNAEPYNVYGGAQDNGVWVGPSNYEASTEWHQSGAYPYKELLGGDGMQIAIDQRDNSTVYTGYQFGNYYRINRRSGQSKPITPQHELGERPLRWNWQTPIALSHFQQDVLYMGANKVYRSFDRGDNWTAISGDLTQGGKAGNVPYGTITTLSESPMQFGLLYAGTDDGLIHVTRGDQNWTRITAGLPANLWVSRVVASAHVQGRVYATLNGYRNDDFSAYLYVSENYGTNWERIGNNLPAEPLNVVREDPSNPNLLFAGSDHGVYVSLDRGQTFNALDGALPATPVHDLVIQPTAKDLLIGTHGRSMYKLHIGILQQITPEVLATDLYLFDLNKIRGSRSWGKKTVWRELKYPSYPVTFYSKNAGTVNWEVSNTDGLVLQNGSWAAKRGLNAFNYDLTLRENAVKPLEKALNTDSKAAVNIEKTDIGSYFLPKGKYQMKVGSITKPFVIE